MLKRFVKIVSKLLLLVVTIVIVDTILIATLPVNLFFHQSNATNYSTWMEDTINDDTKLIDIKMLGAHDAFSSNINLNSNVDLAMVKADDSAAKLASSNFSFLYKGLLTRLMKAQHSNVTTLLEKGVRYLDVRLSYSEQASSWFTTHTYLSDNALIEFKKVSDFLENNKGEIIIFDIQHIFDERTSNGRADTTSYNEVKELLIESGLYQKAVDFSLTPLKDMTYQLALDGSSSGKVVIIAKNISDDKILDYSSSIRSSWADTIYDDELVEFIASEVNTVKNDVELMNCFRVMQAQKTAQLSPFNATYKTLISWSLLSIARHSNSYVMNNENFDVYLNTLPIFMVDYSDTNYNNFNKNIMEKIIDLNS